MKDEEAKRYIGMSNEEFHALPKETQEEVRKWFRRWCTKMDIITWLYRIIFVALLIAAPMLLEAGRKLIDRLP